jgi:protein TonB
LLAYQPPARDRPPLRRRATGLALALAINLLILLAMIGVGRIVPMARQGSGATIVDLLPSPASEEEAPAQAPLVEPEREQEARTERAPSLPEPPRIILPAKPTISTPKPLPWIEMTREEYAASDVSRIPKADRGGGAPSDSEAVGRGPNGEILYAAEWAREPTDAELGGYLPRNAPDGYGLVACRTVAGNRVEDCVELENYPRGSHLARAVRLAAWQFRVRPPRKNGRPMIGEWVQIRIDYYSRRSGD